MYETLTFVPTAFLKEKFGLFVDFEFAENGLLGQWLIDSRWFEKNPPTESGWKLQ